MSDERIVYIVDDDADVRDSLEMLLRRMGYRILPFDSARALLAAGVAPSHSCVLADVRMPDMDGLALQRELKRKLPDLPVIMMTGHGDVAMAVQAMKEGAIEFLEKPFEKESLIDAIENAFARMPAANAEQAISEQRLKKSLTEREREVFDLLVEGHQNKMIAFKLGISTRTVEVHRARIMDKLEAKNLADLVKRSLRDSRSGK
jgi:two-component system, LuxR family, response regulator FixJ